MSRANLSNPPKLPNEIRAFLGAVKDFAPEQRAEQAAGISLTLTQLVAQVISIRQANAIICYSDRLSSQIPTSYAGNAFRDFQRSMFEIELVRLVRLWDPPEWNRNCLQTVYWLTVDPVVRALCDTQARTGHGLDPDIPDRFLEQEARRWRRLDKIAPHAFRSGPVERMQSFTQKFLAHPHIQIAREKTGPVHMPVYADEHDLLSRAIVLTDLLSRAIRGTGFDWSGTIEIARSNAEALWHGCKFDVLE
jgi:AbiU2